MLEASWYTHSPLGFEEVSYVSIIPSLLIPFLPTGTYPTFLGLKCYMIVQFANRASCPVHRL